MNTEYTYPFVSCIVNDLMRSSVWKSVLMLILLVSGGSILAQSDCWDQNQKIVHNDRNVMDYFGTTVSISGSTMILSAHAQDSDTSGGAMLLDAGSIYVFEKNDSGDWEQDIKLVPSDRASGDGFGQSLSVDGNYIVVGASGKNMGTGSAYFYEKNDDGNWIAKNQVISSDIVLMDNFGYSVAISGEYAAVGAYNSNLDVSGVNSKDNAGAVYIFKRGADGNWAQVQKLVASDRLAGASFGNAVSIDNHQLIVGAYGTATDTLGLNSLDSSGAVYIFELASDSSSWSQTQKIIGWDRTMNDQFGDAISLSGKNLIVGSKRHKLDPAGINSKTNSGAVYVFRKNENDIWRKEQKLVNSDRFIGDFFGQSVALSGNYALVGAPGEDEDEDGLNAISNSGAIYFYERATNGTWSEINKVVQNDRDVDAYFGVSVGLDDTIALIGSNFDQEDILDANPLFFSGSGYIFKSVCAFRSTAETRDTNTVGICPGDSITVGDVVYKSAGTYNDTLMNYGGGDSVHVTVLSIYPVYNDTVNSSICQGDSVNIFGVFRSNAGYYSDTTDSKDGCDSISVVNLTLNPVYIRNGSATICSGDSLNINGTFRNSAGLYRDTLASKDGCDSVVVTEVTMNPIYNDTVSASICSGDSTLIGGQYRKIAGDYAVVYPSKNSCDSTVVTSLSILPIYSDTNSYSICSGDSVLINGVYFKSAQTVVTSLKSVADCDSIITSIISVLTATRDTNQLSVCNGDSVLIAGSFQKTAGFYTDSLTRKNTCDSIVVYQLNVLNLDSSEITLSYYNGDSVYLSVDSSVVDTFVWYSDMALSTEIGIGDSLIVSTSSDSIFYCQSNCGSTVLTINTRFIERPSSLDTISFSICPGGSVTVDGHVYGSAGTYRDTFVNVSGGDSVQVSIIAILPTYLDSLSKMICLGDSLLIGAKYRSLAGDYTVNYLSKNSCDSIEVISLSTYSFQDTLNNSICAGDSILIGGVYRKTAGYYANTFTSSLGCDSVWVTNLTINPIYNDTVNASICAGDSVLIGGAYRKTAGNYTVPLSSKNGCDSTVVAVLTVLPSYSDTNYYGICAGDSVSIEGIFIKESETIITVLSSKSSCDSIVTSIVRLLSPSRDTSQLSICFGDSLFLVGGFQKTAGFYTDSLTRKNTCDSIAVYQLNVLNIDSSEITLSYYSNDSVFLTVDSSVVDTFVWYSDIGLTDQIGLGDQLLVNVDADSSFYIQSNCGATVLTVNTQMLSLPSSIDTQSYSICNGEELKVGDNDYTMSGTYNDTLENVLGGDSIQVSILTVNPNYLDSINSTICLGDSILIGGKYRSVSGDYKVNYLSKNTCDSLIVTSLSLQSEADTLQRQICLGDSVFLLGAYRTASGFYSDTMSTDSCNSIIVYQLTAVSNASKKVRIKYFKEEKIYLTVDSSIVDTFVWYSDPELTNQVGLGDNYRVFINKDTKYYVQSTCNNTILEIDIVSPKGQTIPTSTETQNVSICPGSVHVVGSSTYSNVGTYTDVLANRYGGDSTIITVIKVLSAYRDTVQLNICSGDSALIKGAYESVDGSYTDTLVRKNGCDSILVYDLNLITSQNNEVDLHFFDDDSIFLSIDSSVVDTFVWFSDIGLTDQIGLGNGFYVEQNVSDSYYIQSTCGSTILNIIIDEVAKPTSRDTQIVSICSGDTYTVGSNNYSTAGTYTSVLKNKFNGDSVIVTYLSLLSVSIDTIEMSVCFGDSVEILGAYESNVGFYADTLVRKNGCDSIDVYHLNVLDNNSSFIILNYYGSDSMFLTVDSSVVDTFVWFSDYGLGNQIGVGDSFLIETNNDSTFFIQSTCGSTILSVNIDYRIDPLSVDTQEVSICTGDVYAIGTHNYVNPGVYLDTLTNKDSGDSIIYTVLSMRTVYVTPFPINICGGDSVFIKGNYEKEEGLYLDTLVASNLCDSVIVYDLQLIDSSLVTVNNQYCVGDTVWLTIDEGIIDTFVWYSDLSLNNTVATGDSIRLDTLTTNQSFYIRSNCGNSLVEVAFNKNDTIQTFPEYRINSCYEEVLLTLDSSLVQSFDWYTDTDLEELLVQGDSALYYLPDNFNLYLPYKNVLCREEILNVKINLEDLPDALVDTLIYLKGKEITDDLHLNDQEGTFDVSILESVIGLDLNVEDSTVKYTVPFDIEIGETDSFTYKMCDENCMLNCDTSTVYMISGERGTIALPRLIIPTLFTPNGDGENDFLRFKNAEYYDKIDVKIYNRVGDLIYETREYNNKFNGSFRGSEIPEDTYYLFVEILNLFQYKGILVIER